MSTSDFQLTEDKCIRILLKKYLFVVLDLFTFQDETKLWIPKEFIEKYQQLPFYDIIEHSEKYEDCSYYIDIPSSPMNKVIDFLMDKNNDIDSLDLKDSYDIYKTLYEYSVTIHNEIQSDLLFHVKELFYEYLKDNNYNINGSYDNYIDSNIPMELFNLEEKKIIINGLFTPKRKDEFLYYSLLFKMMNITKVNLTYDYSSNIPLEYICPSCIKDIFPSLKEITINVNTHYKETGLLLNPNSDDYIMEYTLLLYNDACREYKRKKYECYTESEMNEYNKISSLDFNKLYYSEDFIDSYNRRRRSNQLRKLNESIVNEAIYTNDYSNIEISKTEDKYTLNDQVSIKYDYEKKDKIFCINNISSKLGISQLLLLPSHLFISQVILNEDFTYQNNSMLFMNSCQEDVFDSLTTLNVNWIRELTNEIDYNLFYKIMTTHVFPNVTELLYNDDDNDDDNDNDNDDDDDDDNNNDNDNDDDDNDDDDDNNNNNDQSFKLSLIKKECFPKLHIINYDIEINTGNFKSLFPADLISMIDTIRINNIDYDQKEKISLLLYKIAYTHSIHINIIDDECGWIYSSRFENIKKLDSFEKYKQNIDSLDITFINDDPDEIDNRNLLERFLKNNIVEHLNKLTISFADAISIEYLTWISTLFNDNKFKIIRELKIDLHIEEDLSSEYLSAYENIMIKLISKASRVNIEYCTMTFINRLIPKGCFHRTTQLNLDINDIPDDNFCKLYTTDNFPQLKSIKFYERYNIEQWLDFIKTFCKYMNNNNFPSSSIVRLGEWENNNDDDYIYDPNNSILRCKYDSNSFINTIIGTQNVTMSKYEIETLFDYIYDDEQLSKLTKCITTGKFPKLKALNFWLHDDISSEQANICKQQLKDSSFSQENHVYYKFY
ncbi:hypothetical protein WA158_005685 [Blastocystis sp. Blastoise]